MEAKQFEHNCDKCGALLKFSPGEQSLVCEFCGTINKIERPDLQVAEVEQSEFLVPMSVDKNDLTSVTQSYMVTGDFTPDDLVQKATITRQFLYYVPTYIFQGSYQAQWTASFGYDRTEHYTEYVSQAQHYSDGRHAGYKQVPVTKTKTVTDWRPMNGSDSGSFVVQVYAGSKLTPDIIKLVEDASLSGKITDFNKEFLVGFEVEKFVVTDDRAYADKAKSTVNAIIDANVKKHGQGDRQRDWNWTANIDKKVVRVLMPVAHSVFEYEGKEYNVWIDGSDVTKMVGDPLPVDKDKQKKAMLGLIPAAVFLVLCIAGFQLTGTQVFNWFTLIGLLIALGYAAVRYNSMLEYSKAIRGGLLAQIKASNINTDTLSPEEQAHLKSSYERPPLPYFADTKNDKLLLPGLSVLCGLMVVFTSFSSPSSPEKTVAVAETAKVEATADQKPAQEEPKADNVPAQPAQPVQEPVPQNAQQTQQPSAEQSNKEPQKASEMPATSKSVQALIAQIINGQKAGNDSQINAGLNDIKQMPVPRRGDRKVARQLNDEGLALLKTESYQPAIQKFSEAVAADPADQEVQNNLGYAYLLAGNYAAAGKSLEAAIALDPMRSSAWFNLATLFAKAGNEQNAVATGIIAYRMSKNQQKTLDFLTKQSQTDNDPKIRAFATKLLSIIQK